MKIIKILDITIILNKIVAWEVFGKDDDKNLVIYTLSEVFTFSYMLNADIDKVIFKLETMLRKID